MVFKIVFLIPALILSFLTLIAFILAAFSNEIFVFKRYNYVYKSGIFMGCAYCENEIHCSYQNIPLYLCKIKKFLSIITNCSFIYKTNPNFF